MTNRSFIARFRVGLKTNQLDDLLPSKYLYDTGMDIAQLLIKRDADTRKIYNSPELFTKLECVELMEVSNKMCGNIPIPCSQLMRSVKKLPDSFMSSKGGVVIVTPINNSGQQFIQTIPSSFIKTQRREFKSKAVYFWIQDNYLYTPSFVKFVDIYILPLNSKEVDLFNGKSGCTPFLDCKNYIPGYLINDVIRLGVQLIGVSKSIPADENSNLNENIKN